MKPNSFSTSHLNGEVNEENECEKKTEIKVK